MAVELVREGGRILAKYQTELGTAKAVDLSSFSSCPDIADQALDPILGYINRLAPRSATTSLQHLATLGKSLNRICIRALPTNEEDWQSLVLRIHHDVITDPSSTATLETRVTGTLATINKYLRHLQEEGIVPLSTIFPNTDAAFNRITKGVKPRLLGHSAPEPVDSEVSDKLLFDIDLSERDANYLDLVRERLAGRMFSLREGLLEYWTALKSHVEWGRKAIASIDVDELERRLIQVGRSNSASGKFGFRARPYCDPTTEEGLARLLALLQKSSGSTPLSYKAWAATPLLPKAFRSQGQKLIVPAGVSMTTAAPRHETLLRLRWFLGTLTASDVGVLAALIISEHPSFTPEAITQGRLFDKHGKRYLQVGDQSLEFTVLKHRAHSPKKEGLSALTTEILTLVSSLNLEVRECLRGDEHPLADALFLTYNTSKQAFCQASHSAAVTFLNGTGPRGEEGRSWLGTFVPSIVAAGHTRGAVTLKKIRDTQGVLEWFRSGSIQAMARKLGNKEQTAIDHYLPKSLLQAWNVRLIRRFHNLWISVAAAHEDYLLDVTDFSTASDLQRFIVDMLEQHNATSSPLAKELHSRFSTLPGSDGNIGTESEGANLAINLSKNSLASIYLLVDSALRVACSEAVLDRVNPDTGISMRSLIDLGTVLRHRLPGHEKPEYRKVHAEAERLAESLLPRIQWSQLLVEKATAP